MTSASDLLVAAFEPFGGRSRNAALEAAETLARLHGVTLSRLPTAFAPLPAALQALVDRGPRVLLLVGESHQTRVLRVEQIALNLMDARIPDNLGAQPRGEPVQSGAELARKVSFDVRAVAKAGTAGGARCEPSFHAGTFCCNAALFIALGLAGDGARTRVAFVHVPASWFWPSPWQRRRKCADSLWAIAQALSATI